MGALSEVRPGARSLPDWLTATLLFATVALAVRLPLLGNPVSFMDEEFYLLVADRMAHGVLPYVGIWDRKPIGLFLIYRAGMGLPVDPVLGYELIGLAASVATAFVVERLAALFAPPRGARAAALAYLLFQPVFNAALGQSPVFYNLPVALAALIVIRAAARDRSPMLVRDGLLAMALIGIALQIKYTALFEGLALGLVLLWRGRADGWTLPRLGGAAAGWVLASLVPTLAAWLAYVALGHGEAFVQANFLSIFGRGARDGEEWRRLGGITAMLLPFWVLVGLGRPARGDPRAWRAAQVWAAAALAGFLGFGTWYDHYAAPLLAPLAMLAAPALARHRFAAPVLLAIGTALALTVTLVQRERYGSAAEFARANALIAQALHGGCLYVFDGHPAFYRAAPACIPTRYAFPAHLATSLEANAIGTDPAREVGRIMAGRPDVVVTTADASYMPNRASRAVLDEALAAGYQRYAVATIGAHHYALWRRR
jgi:hypothetical protein